MKPTEEEKLRRKKDKDKAESIVSELKRMSQPPKRYADVISNVNGNSSVSEVNKTTTVDDGNPISMVNFLFNK